MSAEPLNERYRPKTELGRGGMGVDYRGQDLLLGRPVAVKLLTHQIERAHHLPPFHGRHSFLLKPWVTRYPVSPVWRDQWKDVILEAH